MGPVNLLKRSHFLLNTCIFGAILSTAEPPTALPTFVLHPFVRSLKIHLTSNFDSLYPPSLPPTSRTKMQQKYPRTKEETFRSGLQRKRKKEEKMQKETAIRNWGWRGPEENKSDKKCFLEFTEVHLHFSFLGLFCWVMLGAAIIVSAYHNSQRVSYTVQTT